MFLEEPEQFHHFYAALITIVKSKNWFFFQFKFNFLKNNKHNKQQYRLLLQDTFNIMH